MEGAGEKTSFGHDPESDEDSGKVFIDFIVPEVRSLESEKKSRKGKQNQRLEKKNFLSLLWLLCEIMA